VYHVKGKLELATEKQATLSPVVRFYRETCCQVERHCVNAGEQGYRRGMLEVLARIKVAMNDVCSKLNMRRYKVISPVDLLGIHVQMDKDELIGLLGEHPVHMSSEGYNKLAESIISMVERPGALFSGEKREREEAESEAEAEVVCGWHRKNHEWLHSQVSGTGRWKTGKVQVQGQSGQGGGGEGDFGSGGAKRNTREWDGGARKERGLFLDGKRCNARTC
jgi:hypothetical protein